MRVRLQPGGYTVAGPAGSVGLRAVQNGGEIVRHANGVSQTTDFGSAAVVVDGERTEQFLTVTRRQGKHTWRWQLDTSLAPRVGNDGAVVFLNESSRRVAGPVLAPVQILDARGRNVTPEGARWSTGLNRKGWELRLTIDDSELPLPYVIDPAVTHRATTVSNNGAGGAANISLTYPAGVAASTTSWSRRSRSAANATVATPGGWAAGRVSQNGTNVRLVTFYKVATASEPASQSFTWTGTQQAVGAISAYYGIKASLGNANILDVMGAAGTGNSTTASASSITTTTANALLVASFGINNNGTFGAVTGMTERWDAASASATPANRASGAQSDSTQVAAGATGAKTSALGATRQWAAHLHSFEVDNVNPSLTRDDRRRRRVEPSTSPRRSPTPTRGSRPSSTKARRRARARGRRSGRARRRRIPSRSTRRSPRTASTTSVSPRPTGRETRRPSPAWSASTTPRPTRTRSR